MEKIRKTRNHIKMSTSLALKIEDGSLIDFETTGVPRRDKEHEVITLGYLVDNKLVIIQRRTKGKKPFYREIIPILQKLPRPFYSYNSKFEKDIMNIELGIKVTDEDFIDLMKPWKEKANKKGLKWPKLDELITEPEEYFGEYKISGKDVPGLWKAFLAGASESLLNMIMEHCLSDILREMILLIRYHR